MPLTTGIIAYSSPFIPPEWIAAHGLRPRRLLSDCDGSAAAGQGVCPFAHGFSREATGSGELDGVVFASTCDQMRRTAEQFGGSGVPAFLLNVPATWQSDSSRRLYVDELKRLSAFLVRLGAMAPEVGRMGEAMREYDAKRRALRAAREWIGGRGFAEALAELGETNELAVEARTAALPTRGAAIALVGGPLRRSDWWIFDVIEAAGGRVALDATETGERGFPAPFDEGRIDRDPLDELARAYFDTIPDAFRRPDSLLHEYLAREIAGRGIRGIVLLRYVWCDQWHAQLARLKESTGLAVIEVDLGGADQEMARARTRIESLVGILQ